MPGTVVNTLHIIIDQMTYFLFLNYVCFLNLQVGMFVE